MSNQVIYEEPKLNWKQKVLKYWNLVEVYPQGFKQNYINKSEGNDGDKLERGIKKDQ